VSYKNTLSANTLFHFTNSFDNLEGILTNEFYPRYCLENFDVILAELLDLRELAIPMISFCDIPLSQIRKHVGYYGCYAIGLTKEWGVNKNICPVLYTYKESGLSFHLRSMLSNALSGISGTEKPKFEDIFNDWFKFIKFVKPYEGKLWRSGKYCEEKITFYDEREWRFCPNIPMPPVPNQPRSFISKKSFMQPDEIREENIMLEKFKLSFEPKDVKYIIVDKEDEILEMVNKIINIKQTKYTHADLQILTTRIISMEHIFEDF
jgi:hypothetical protein